MARGVTVVQMTWPCYLLTMVRLRDALRVFKLTIVSSDQNLRGDMEVGIRGRAMMIGESRFLDSRKQEI